MHRSLRSIAVFALLPLAAVCLHACGPSSDAPDELVIADFHFAHYELRDWTRHYGPHACWHRFGPEWTSLPRENGPWGLGTELTVDLYLPAGADCLHLAASTLPILARAGQTLELRLDDRPLGAWPLPDDQEPLEISVALPANDITPGRNRLTLHLDHHLNTLPEPPAWADGRPLSLRLHRLRVTATDPDADTVARWHELTDDLPADHTHDLVALPSHATAPADTGHAHPDILMILLDAARPDHFGCYGYHRDTTPCIDRLADDGVAFTNVVANTPYTIASMPTILTGRHWRDHGVLAREHALSDSFVTLAEVLHADGYHTIAVSGTPRMSPGPNLDQGFDEFILAYEHPDDGATTRHELPERLLRERSAEGLTDAPVFCFLHLVPPHEPYLPGPEHDRWSDPAYDGAMDGSYQQVQALVSGDLEWNEADRRKLRDLYDGNLHRADASVGRMVADWRGLERDRELLVVVLADHGEAFAEHGRFGHNATVYDEMTRIPFIVHPARLAGSLLPGRDNLTDLTDLMPLLLHTVEVPLPAGTSWPRRFLGLLDDPATPRATVIIKSTGAMKGVRTDRYLAVTNDWQQQELYDLHDDPAATRNLRWRYPELYSRLVAGMQAMLRNRGQAIDAGAASMSEQDRKMLESLGYL